ncbi:GGDEF domain-containing protein [Tsukamurella sp. NPDC003166]|uniref:GGDEF domain-containing protein n=1 Tax=Tsukamurella sp. NPDC003166 TaxID=3154444 RepID=UPI0033A969B5
MRSAFIGLFLQIGHIVKTWWRGGPDYQQRIAYFDSRGLLRGFQLVVSACALVLGGLAANLLLVDQGDAPHFYVVVQVIGAVTGLFWAMRWQVRPVPSESGAMFFVVTSDILIVAVSATDVDVMADAFGLSALTLVAIFVAFVLSPAQFMANAGICAVAIAAFAVGMYQSYGWPETVLKVTLLGITTIAVPASVQIGLAFLSQDATESDTDPLTRTLNRRGFHRATGIRITDLAAGRPQVSVALLLVDVDDFKAINDVHGHETGDAVLTRVADVLRDVTQGGLVARLGGDEFAVLMVGRARSRYVRIANRIHWSIESEAGLAGVPVTASIGVAIGDIAVADEEAAVSLLLNRADEAMYEAKRGEQPVVISTVLDYPALGVVPVDVERVAPLMGRTGRQCRRKRTSTAGRAS